ncbi:hypothetical protein ACFV5K_33515, partial [Streptomyces sp. NPDC059744]
VVFLFARLNIPPHQTPPPSAVHTGEPDWWKPSWIPVLAEADAHYGMILEAGQGDGTAPLLTYRETDYAKDFASSLGELLTAVADVLEHGQENTALTRGYRASVHDARLVWH